MKVQVLSSAFF